MSVRIIKAGIHDTIQDMGRYGYQQFGINPNGAMDKYSMAVANMLVGNKMSEAVIELHFPSSVFLFTRACLLAISGADFSPAINGDPVEINQPIVVAKNDILQFQKPVRGARCYLAIDEGFELEPWLNSYSTNTKAHAGGLNGRTLMKDDEIFFKKNYPYKNPNSFKILPWKATTSWGDEDPDYLYIIQGNEFEQLTEESKQKFLEGEFIISGHSDRMAYKLENNPLARTTNEELVSTGVGFGTIQLLPDGNLIILVADHQSTGGYPRIGHVISAHHSKLAQMNAGDVVKFKLTDVGRAERLIFKQQQHLKLLQSACRSKLF